MRRVAYYGIGGDGGAGWGGGGVEGGCIFEVNLGRVLFVTLATFSVIFSLHSSMSLKAWTCSREKNHCTTYLTPLFPHRPFFDSPCSSPPVSRG